MRTATIGLGLVCAAVVLDLTGHLAPALGAAGVLYLLLAAVEERI